MFFIFLFCLFSLNVFSLELEARKEVITFTAKWCDNSCSLWLSWIDELKEKYPQVTFRTYDIDEHFDKASDYNLTSGVYSWIKDDFLSVPISVWVEPPNHYKFNSARTLNGIDKWIENALHKQFHPIFSTNNIHALGEWDKRHEASITVLSKEEPDFSFFLAEMPTLGYSWGVQNHSTTPVIFIRSVFNNVSMAFDYKWENMMHKILSPIIPLWLAKSNLGIETIYNMAKNDNELIFALFFQTLVWPRSGHTKL